MQERKALAGGDITRTRHTFEANPTVFSGRDDTIVPIDKRFGESPSRLQLLSDFPEVSISCLYYLVRKSGLRQAALTARTVVMTP